MKLGKWALVLGLAGLLFCGSADAQTIMANKLCLHSGSEYYVNGPFYGYPNHGSFRYFPSFTHWTSTSNDDLGLVYPWKISGWAWGGMQANIMGTTWYWQTALQDSGDNPYGTDMSFDYPSLFYNSIVPHTGFPMPVYGGTVPTTVPIIGGNQFVFPGAAQGLNAYLNIFAYGDGTWNIPSTAPFYGWSFGFNASCLSAMTVPSVHSIVEIDWTNKGPYGQYTLMDGNTPDCIGGAGNKGRNYSIIMDADNGYLWAWTNACTGVQQEWAMCLFVCDAVTVPVNAPGATNASNPYVAYDFDVGVATFMPYLSSGGASIGFVTEDYTGAGGTRIIMGAFAFWPCIGPYSKFNYRVPHGWDVLTDLFLGISFLFIHTPVLPYPACMFGTTIGAHTGMLPFPADPALLGAEIRWSSYASGKGEPMSASYMATYF